MPEVTAIEKQASTDQNGVAHEEQYGVAGGLPPRDYPVADFPEPLEWHWSEDWYQVQKALKDFIEQAHADY